MDIGDWGICVVVCQPGSVVWGLDACGMVKKGMAALIRLGNWMALRTAEHAGLELNLIDRVSLIDNAFYARHTYWVSLTESQYGQLVGHGCLVQRCLGKLIGDIC